ncbi:VOC family protein [Rhodoplanes sp. TEM]|uniref:VOC family protein n=1 Tax=Rhodoplanes tepidamans TaxID=200616 RepID=A0ABT5JDM1_RHOTP|nr:MULTISPECIES: VOC family protein [Rhodoplanes]MDC7787446.1 VOC family protein [Rhodoplanes tepidamans]MDC7986355.1 VOC family protein [Rhodoplanes sp. TEM]MDQ0358068.1 PhnB protein [Rhodoplanes tepidamans]
MKVQPYLFLDGRCEEAIAHYRTVLGAEPTVLMRFEDGPDEPPPGTLPPNSAEKVMHAELRIGDSVVMLSDGNCAGRAAFEGVSLSLTAADDAQAERLFAALADGGTVQMPIGKTFFASRFGMVADRFGVSWMIVTPPAG